MYQNKIVKFLAILGMVIIAAIFSVMPTVQILGIELFPVRIPPQVIDVETETRIVQFEIPTLDLREYPINHFQVEQWFLEKLNYHRENVSSPPFSLDARATITSIEHSIDMRDSRFIGDYASDGRTQEERFENWFADEVELRQKDGVVLGYTLEGELDSFVVGLIVDHLFIDEERASTLLNPDYRYIGIGTSVDKSGNGTLSITLIEENY